MKKKKVLVVGTSGMAGHVIYKYLESLKKYDLGAVSRTVVEDIPSVCIDIEEDLSALENIIKTTSLNFVINCVGLLVKACEACPAEAIFINSFFPHLLENITSGTDTRVIHLSTDCVFSGRLEVDMAYHEDCTPNEINWYGRTKALGELINEKDITLRTSIIGPELKDGVGLLNWFLKQTGTVNGFSNHHWNGITTLEMAKQIDRLMGTDLNGLYHLVPNFRITKYALLKLFNETFETDLEIQEVGGVLVNKVLANNRVVEYDPCIPRYEDQLFELKEWMKNHPRKTK
jgi:dTDP-4-dehydrorhamnose reductase